MSKRPAKNRYPNPPETVRMVTGISQPLTIAEFTMYYFENNQSVGLVIKLIARLLAVLVGRRILNAPDFYYILTGTWHKTVSFSDWTPEQEHEEGLQPGVILDR